MFSSGIKGAIQLSVVEDGETADEKAVTITEKGGATMRVKAGVEHLVAANAESKQGQDVRHWSFEQLQGRVCEISAKRDSASLTEVCRLILQAQQQSEPVVWVACRDSYFFPPDFEKNGVDLRALVVVCAPNTVAGGRAVDRLLRSGAFGLLILDVEKNQELPMPLLGRIMSLCKKQNAATICLTEKIAEEPSLGSVISLRTEALREDVGQGRFRCKVRGVKDKRRGPGWESSELAYAPPGLR